MNVSQPIFIIGTGRCGSTVFHRLLAHHPQVAWLSGFCNYLPGWPQINKILLTLDTSAFLNPVIHHLIRPSEVTLYWESLSPGFSRSVRDLTGDDVYENVKQRLQTELAKHLTSRRSRLLHKITGWPKADYLQTVFPDARFIHIIRDGRAVAHSLLNWPDWHGWQGPANWRWGPLPEAYSVEWDTHHRSFIALAALQWKILMDAHERVKNKLDPDRYIEIKYETFVEDPVAVFLDILEFCRLDPAPRLMSELAKYNLQSRNDQWKRNLSASQIETLLAVLESHLKLYGYR